MYAGNTIPTEWPRRADNSTYEAYAKLPSWHVEEAASLAAELIPRPGFHLNFRPLHGEPKEPKPYEDAKTWGILLDEPQAVGRVISLLARARGVGNWDFAGPDLYIAPMEFLEFCDRYGVGMPGELRNAIQEAAVTKSEPTQPVPAAPKQPEARYRNGALQVARELRDAGARPVTASSLKLFIESNFAPTDRTVVQRMFQDYLKKWRRAEATTDDLGELLAAVLPESGGRPRDEDEAELKKRLPEKYAHIKWPASLPPKQTTKTTQKP